MEKCIVFAHRGDSGNYPENTKAAFVSAMTLGVDGIEFDVQLSKDGVPVILHDETLERQGGIKGDLKDFTLEELRKIDIGSFYSSEFKNERIITLKEFFELSTTWGGIINIELKNSIYNYPGIEQKVNDLIIEMNMLERVIVSSFSKESLKIMKEVNPKVKLGMLLDKGERVNFIDYEHLGIYSIHPHHTDLSPQLVSEFSQKSIPVYSFTVNSNEDLIKYYKMGVNGVFSDYPTKLKNELGRLDSMLTVV